MRTNDVRLARCVISVAVVLLGTAPVSAGTAASSLDLIRLDPSGAVSVARAVSARASDPSPAAVLRSMLDAQGLGVAPSVAGRLEPVAGAPATLAVPLARLSAAVHAAEAMRARALAALTPPELALAASGLLVSERLAPGARVANGKVAELSARAWTRHARTATIAAKVDEGLLRAAALTVLEAIEDASAALHVPQTQSGPSGCGATGDVVFESSDCSIIVGNTDVNGYGPGVDPMILIDLGGNDSYSNGSARAEANVRVLLDVSGDDTYAEAASAIAPAVDPIVAAGQGAGFGGVGVLADLAGSDSYSSTSSATSPEPGPSARHAQAFGQGVGIIGAGVLADVGGPNHFTLDATSTGGPASSVGQGSATIGLGALIVLDDPSADDAIDSYEARSTSTLHLVEKTPGFERFGIGPAVTNAQASTALGGAGVMVDASGSDSYVAHASGGVATTLAQGGAEAGAALLVDVVGDDILRSVASGDTTLSLITTEPAACWDVEVRVTVGDSVAIAQGSALVGAGALIDGGGNDTRSIEAASRAVAIAEAYSDHVCAPAPLVNRAVATATSGNGDAAGQGSARGGVAVLVDVVGDDANSLDARSEAIAHAKAVSPGPDIETPTATDGDGRTLGQGYAEIGFGLAADAFGEDRYASSATSYFETLTSSLGSAMLTPGVQRIQGWGLSGYGWLLELDGTDEYTNGPGIDSAAANNACWSNAPAGRGRDLQLGGLLPAGCP